MSEHDPGASGADGVGSVGEEAAKLLGALSEWARDHGDGLGEGLGGLADHAAASAREVNEHLATGSAECTYCPICRTVHLIRETSPEVKAHLASAAGSLLQAATAMLETHVPGDERAAGEPGARGARVERIDLDRPDGESGA